jgi:hypothetical protein
MAVERVAGFPYFEVEFDKRGRIDDEDQVQALIGFLQGGGASDLLVLSHGWNNDMAQARSLYERLLTSARAQLDAGNVPGVAGRDLAVFAVLWPSKKFADKDLIPSGAAGFAPGVETADLERQIADLREVADSDDEVRRLDEARALLPELEASVDAQRQFVDLLRGLLPEPDGEMEAELPPEVFRLEGDEVLARLGTPPALPEPELGEGGAAALGDDDDGGETLDAIEAMAVGSLFDGIKAGARNFLNLVTYYKMKNRAGVVGAGGVYSVLRRARDAKPDLKLHLAGHSFGGRLVSAAAKGPDDQPAIEVQSMALLQAAFSHYGFADDWDGKGGMGFFRRVVTDPRVAGPVIVTHTKNDRAVGLAYPIASRLARQVASAIGDASDVYGGIGRNGAQKTPEAKDGMLLAPGGAYALAGGSVFNLQADEFISSHSDVTGEAVAYALLSAVAAT